MEQRQHNLKSTPDKRRVDGELAFVLHTYPYRETSLIAEVLSVDYGRVSLVARGARRPRSALRGVLMAFQPLEMAWFGQGELCTLAKAEWRGGQPLLQGEALLLGYYMNELLLRLLAREDPHPSLFQAYRLAVSALATGHDAQPALRRFEKSLLKELGYGVVLDYDADTGAPLDPEKYYAYVVERGVVEACHVPEGGALFSGRVLRELAADNFSNPETLAQGKQLMRMLINHTLGGQVLSSRRVFMALQEL